MERENSVAWQSNNMSCVLGSWSATMISATIFLLIRPKSGFGIAAVIIPALLFAFSPFVWEYSIGAEVFAMNNSLISSLVFLAVLCDFSSELKSKSCFSIAALGAFICGLSLSNQHTSSLLMVILVPYDIRALTSQLSIQRFFLLVLCGLSGLSPYYYLVYSSSNPKPGSWGDMSTVEGFLRHVLRMEYGTFKLGMIIGEESFLERLWIYLRHVHQDTYGLFLPLGLVAVAEAMAHTIYGYSYEIGSRVEEIAAGAEYSSSAPSAVKQRRNKGGQKKGGAVAGASLSEIKKVNDQFKSVSSPEDKLIGVAAGYSVRRRAQAVLWLFGAWLFYVLVWHGVLSNLPLSKPMPFAVHAR